jgi:hypothetical protein
LFSYFYLQVKVKRLKITSILNERVAIVLVSGCQGWSQRQVADEFNARPPERNQITLSAVGKVAKKIRTNMAKRLRKCVECRGEHIEHIM